MTVMLPGENTKSKNKVLKWILAIFLTVLVLLGGFTLWLWRYHHIFIYRPFNHRVESEGKFLQLLQLTSAPQEIDLVSPDQTRLRAYWFENSAENNNSQQKLPAVLVLHGNEGNLERVFAATEGWQRHLPVHALVLSYRGYGFSEGSPNMKGIRMDSQTALDYLLAHPKVDSNQVIVYGHSLGGAVTLHLTAENASKLLAVVVENTFLSIPKMISHAQPALQAFGFVVTELWDNEKQVESLTTTAQSPNVRFPHFMFISGQKDTVVPPAQMNELWRQAQQWKTLRPQMELQRNHMEKCYHDCHHLSGYYPPIVEFLQKISPSFSSPKTLKK